MKRTWVERTFIANGSIVAVAAVVTTAANIALDDWRQAITTGACGMTVIVMLASFVRFTTPPPIHGRTIWLGPIDAFVEQYDNGANPFEQWGIRLEQRVEIRVVHDDLDAAFATYMAPAPVPSATGLAGQPADGVVAVDAVGADVMNETSEDK